MRSDFDGVAGLFDSAEGSSRNMTYLYGLADFWQVMFEDSDKIDLLMDANAVHASDVYSKFLQLVSSITLEGVQSTVDSQITLKLLANTEKVVGTQTTYALSDIQECRYIVNRPFLPTVTYEKDVHYFIDADAGTITFYKDPFSDKFPIRRGSDGTNEIAFWMVDAKVDEQLMSKYYGNLIGATPEESTEVFRNFLYGLFFLYTHGPDLSQVRRGLNVALGVPLARTDETILSIRKTPGTEQYFVITDYNSYMLPFGLAPTAAEGDTLKEGDEVTSWVEVKDYLNDGDWWVNLEIPKHIMPYIPEGEPDAYAKPNSYADYLMRNYLKTHTFLVKVNVTTFKNIQTFQELGDIIRNVKPTYTTPIYIWNVPIGSETIRLIEDTGSARIDHHRCEYVFAQVKRFRRGNSVDPLDRCCPYFLRMNLGYPEWELLGLDPNTSGVRQGFNGGYETSLVNRITQFRDNTPYEHKVLRTKFRRDERNKPHYRSAIVFARDIGIKEGDGNLTYNPFMEYIGSGKFCVPLYLTSEFDLASRMSSIGVPVPGSLPVFTLFQTKYSEGPINVPLINAFDKNSSFNKMVENYPTIFFRNMNNNYMGVAAPEQAKTLSYAPPVSHLKEGDYLLCTRVYDRLIAVYWITSSRSGSAREYPSVAVSRDPDTLRVVDRTMPLTRGLGPAIGAPFYTLRNGNYYPEGAESLEGINELGINEDMHPGEGGYRGYYDTLNTGIAMTRGGTKIYIDKTMDLDFTGPDE